MDRATTVRKRRAPVQGSPITTGVLDGQAANAGVQTDTRDFAMAVEDTERPLPMTKRSDEPMQPGAIDATKLAGLSDVALEKTSFLLHEFYADFLADNDDAVAGTHHRDAVVIADAAVSEELLKRGLPIVDDALTTAATVALAELCAKAEEASKASVSYRFTDIGIFVELSTGDESWEICTRREGADIPASPDDALAKRIASSFNLDGDRYTSSLRNGTVYAHKMDEARTGEVASFKSVVVDACKVERGLQSDTNCEFFLVGNVMKGTLSLSNEVENDWIASIGKSFLPKVLTRAAVREKAMPADGMSGMPRSLEEVTPVEFQFWKSTGDDARSIRDALVAERFFTDDNVQIVNSEYRLVVKRTYLYVRPEILKDDAPAVVAPKKRSQHIDTIVGKRDYALITPPEGGSSWGPWVADCAAQVSDDTVLVITDSRETSDIAAVIDAVSTLKHDYAIGLLDTNATRASLVKIGSPFKHHRDEEFVWVYSGAVAKAKDVFFLDVADIHDVAAILADVPADMPTDTSKAAQTTAALWKGERILKTLMPEEGAVEERFILGIVLEPEVVDSQQDIYSVEEIRQAAHKFMEEFQNMGLMHTTIVNDQVNLLESYLTPVDMEIAGITLKAGTWLMGVRVLDDALWEAVKAGELTGFSIGGSAIRVKTDPAEQAEAA